MPSFLHVANGSATTDIIAAASIPGVLSIWADPLYEGPVPGGLSDGELLAVRARYLSGTSPPLLTLTRTGNDTQPLHGSVTITDVGQAVRDRTQDKVATCGIDRWLGGVHLQRDTPWRWDNEHRRITRR